MVSARLCCAICLALVLLPLADARAQDVGPIEENWSLQHKSQLKLGRTVDRPRYQSLEQRRAAQQAAASPQMQTKPTTASAPKTEDIKATPAPPEPTVAGAFVARLPSVKPVIATPTATQQSLAKHESLKPGHALHFVLENDPELSGILTIDQDGFAQVPLVGRLSLAGKTLLEAEAALRAAYANGYYIKPRLMLTLGDGS